MKSKYFAFIFVHLIIFNSFSGEKNETNVVVNIDHCTKDKCPFDICGLNCNKTLGPFFEVNKNSSKKDIRLEVKRRLNLKNKNKISVYRMPTCFFVRVVKFLKALK